MEQTLQRPFVTVVKSEKKTTHTQFGWYVIGQKLFPVENEFQYLEVFL